MINKTGKTALKLLLIVIMAIQPVAITHAMASMDHSQHQTMLANEHSHEGHHHAMHQDRVNGQHDNTGNDDTSNCCNTSACCPAGIVAISTLERMPVPEYVTYLHISWKGVFLPSETKPPQRLVG